MRADRPTEAIPLYEEAIAEEPDFFLPYERLLSALDETKSLITDYWIERAHQAHPSQPIIAWHYCRLLLRTGRLDELAHAHWIGDLRSEAGRVDIVGRAEGDEIYIAWARVLRAAAILLNRPDLSALETAIEELSRLPTDGRACEPALILASVATRLGQPDLAVRAYRSVCRDCRNGDRLQALRRGYEVCLDGVLKYEEALSAANRRCGSFQTTPGRLPATGGASTRSGELRMRYRLPRSSSSCDQRLVTCSTTSDSCVARRDFFGRAVHYYKSEIEAQPGNWQALENLAVVYLVERKYDDAERVWQNYREAFVRSRHLPEWIEIRHKDGQSASADHLDTAHAMREALRLKEKKYEALLLWSKGYQGCAHALDLLRENEAALGETRREHAPRFADALSHRPTGRNEQLRSASS